MNLTASLRLGAVVCLLVAPAASFALWSCAVIETEPGCTPGRTESCTCAGGAQVSQTCQADNTFGPCDCGSDAGDLDVDDLRDMADPSIDEADEASDDLPDMVGLVCIPNELFCEGRQIRECSSDGTASDLVAPCSVAAERCRDGRCVELPEGYGDDCEDVADCGEGAPVCQDGTCLTQEPGSFDEPCWDDLECGDLAPYCNASADTCQAGLPGDPCDNRDDCRTEICVEDGCRAGEGGDPCLENDDCRGGTPLCGPDEVGCQSGIEGDSCGGVDDCSEIAPICSLAGVCQDGNADDECQSHDECGVAFHCGSANRCESGAVLGSRCSTSSQCPTEYCSNNHCAPTGFAYIPPGAFCMGSPWGGTECMGETDPGEVGHSQDERPLHEVTLPRGFFLQETEVTQGQWEEHFPTNNPSFFDACGLDCPVENVNWWEAVAYVNALSESEGLEPCYTLEGDCDPSLAGTNMVCSGVTVSDAGASGNPSLCEGYRLPTETEWEYAYRAGTRTAFYNGGITRTGCAPLDANMDAIGWYCGNAGGTTHVVSALNGVDPKAPNDWGLYDMSGNVGEWVWDWYDSYTSSGEWVPPGVSCSSRVFRGGSWADHAVNCRAANRVSDGPSKRFHDVGFRPARTFLP